MGKFKSNNIYDDNFTLAIYKAEIGKYADLSAEEEIDLGKKIKEGDKASLNKLIRHNLGLVIGVVGEYRNRGISLLELISEGNIGLMDAAKDYDINKTNGARFSTYAYGKIRGKMSHMFTALSCRTRRFPLLLDQIGPGEDEEEKEEKVFGYIKSNYAPVEEQAQNNTLNRLLLLCLSGLTEREREIVNLRYGLENRYEMTLGKIGEMFNLTKERVRKIEQKALQKVRRVPGISRKFPVGTFE
jgi:RNA polymerase primary sigma factor